MKERLLLVDDETGILKVLGISLADSGYQVFTAQSGEEALSIFREKHPTIILTDIKMPGMDGIELLQRIKQESPDTEVIMITGHGDMELAILSLKYEASDFITKPINDEALEIAIKRARETISYKHRLREYTVNLERLVEEKTAKLVAAERMAAVGQTVAALAHAIKNIASGLTGGMYVLEKGIDLDNKTYLLQGWGMVEGNVGKIKGMAMDLLNYCREREPDYRLCDPNKPAREVFVLMRSYAKENGVTLKIDLAEDLSETCFDPESIHRSLLNLVTNGIDACTDLRCVSEAGEVLLRSRRPEGWAVEYQVQDNGCGMDEETRAKIFQGFFSTKGSKGTGLGLMITKKIVDEHGGVIEMESEAGKGTRFCIRIPERDRPGRRNAD
jgi:signal transduction histidine kinase